MCVFFTHVFVYPTMSLCLMLYRAVSVGTPHTHTHTPMLTVKMKSNDSRVLTVVFLDLRRVSLHTTGEREREREGNGLFSLKNSGALIIVGEGEIVRLAMRDGQTRREWEREIREGRSKSMWIKGLGAPLFGFCASWFWFLQQSCHTFQTTITSAGLFLFQYISFSSCLDFISLTRFGHANKEIPPRGSIVS